MKKRTLQKIAVIATMVLIMTGIFTSVMTAWSRPVGTDFLTAWLPAWGIAICIMAPTGFIIYTLISLMLSRIAPSLTYHKKNIVIGILMAVVMESIMGTIVAVQLVGFSTDFLAILGSNLIAALPFAIVVGVIMNLLIKPRLDRFMAS